MKNELYFISILISLACLLIIPGCTPKEDILPENITKDEKPVTESFSESGARVYFYIGNCYKITGTTRIPLSIGEELFEGDEIQVEADSYAEIQFGDMALICIDENSQISISSLRFYY